MGDKSTQEFLDGIDEMTPEQAEALIEMASKEDSGAKDDADQVEASSDGDEGGGEESDAEQSPAEPPQEDEQPEPQPQAPPIDQSTTELLVAQIAELNQQIALLKSKKEPEPEPQAPQAKQDPDSPPLSSEELMEMFGDLSVEAIAAAVHKLTQDGIKSGVSREVDRLIAPLLEQQRAKELASHVALIESAHPDAKDIAESGALAQWVASRPEYLRSAYESVLASGTAKQVISLFDEYKSSQPARPVQAAKKAASGSDAIEKAKEIVAASKSRVPETLSGMSGSGKSKGGIDYDSLSPEALIDALSDVSPESLKDFVNAR